MLITVLLATVFTEAVGASVEAVAVSSDSVKLCWISEKNADGYIIESYENGITPNPCIDCNRYMKFGKLFDRAKMLCCDYVVTGHYARIEESSGGFVLKKAIDETKDQSYVLYSMTQEQLARTKFPLGGMRKTEVRALAERNGFVNADKRQSVNFCKKPPHCPPLD